MKRRARVRVYLSFLDMLFKFPDGVHIDAVDYQGFDGCGDKHVDLLLIDDGETLPEVAAGDEAPLASPRYHTHENGGYVFDGFGI